MEGTFTSLFDDPDVGGLLATVRDITGRKEVEAALQKSEERQALLLKLSDALRTVGDPIELQETAARVLGEHLGANRVMYAEIERDEASAVAVIANCYADDYDADMGQASRVTAGEIPGYTIEKRYVRKGGETVWVQLTSTLVRDASDDPYYALAIIEDIDERKRAEQALLERDEQLVLALQAADAGVSSLDLATGIGVATPRWREVLGFAPPPAPQTFEALLDLVHPDDRERVAALPAESSRSREGLDFEFRLNHPVKGERWILSRSRHVAADGEADRLVGIAFDITFDITERKRLESERARLRVREVAMRAETAERERISRELHDRVAHSMGVVYQNLQLFRALAENAPGRA